MSKKLTKSAAYEMVKNDYTMLYRPMPESIKDLFPVITVQVLEKMGLHFTVNHTGKMIGMQSVSDSCKCNALCKSRILKSFIDLGIDVKDIKQAKKAIKKYLENNPESTDICICAFCFSDEQQEFQTSMQLPLKRNFEIFNNGIIHSDWLPVLNCLYFRGESFGDYASKNAVINSFNVAAKNPLTNFTAWSKNLCFFHEAIQAGHKKPDNFKLVYSSAYINKVAMIPAKYEYIVDAVFTVFTEIYARKHNVMINCGARACLSCLRCYTGYNGKIKYINELLK